ncbi:hypothetical protein [Bdellovibrio bacteriovorus]|uniref:hypothetical protein n=1 Tax=Bdellovibrio bacteriovorus TaxID=959 RepID=UPI0035A577CE
MFQKVSRMQPCKICGKSDWCSFTFEYVICKRISSGSINEKLDRNGEQYWVHSVKSDVHQGTPSAILKARAVKNLALTKVVNQDILKLLNLASEDRDELHRRGLSDPQVETGQYRSFYSFSTRVLIARLLERYTFEELLQVPGFYAKSKTDLMMSKLDGLMIPIRAADGAITAFKIRRRYVQDGQNRFLLLSNHLGVSAGNELHVPIFPVNDSKTLRLTEGELKADIATVFSSVKTIGIPGVSSWRTAIPYVKESGCDHLILSFDSDLYENPRVRRALVEAYKAFKNITSVGIEKW